MEEVDLMERVVVVMEVAWKVVLEVVGHGSVVMVELNLLVEEAVTGMRMVVRKHYKVLLEPVEIMIVLVVRGVELAAVAGMVVEVESTVWAEVAAEVAILTPAHLLLWFTRKEFI